MDINKKDFFERESEISGGITNPLSVKAELHAILYYEEIRKRTDDVYKIAKITGYTPEQILRVKNYLFLETHILSKGIQRFDPSFEIAETWQRLSDLQHEVKDFDFLLIPHELYEMDLVLKGISQEDAHILASEKFPYPQNVTKYYEKILTNDIDYDIIGGGITHRAEEDWHTLMWERSIWW